MGFFKRLLGSQKEDRIKRRGNQFKKLGEVDKCPYCNKKLEVIPKAKKKCPYCEKYIFSRTRPLDRKKVLLTKNQAKEIEIEWQIVNSTRDEVMNGEKEFKKIQILIGGYN